MLIIDKNYKDDILIQHYLEKKDYENLFNIAIQLNLPFEEELQDFSLYKRILEKLYEVNHLESYYFLALNYIYEEKDIEKGFKILEEASSYGCTNSLEYLGNSYLTGLNVEKDLEKSILYYEKASLLNDSSAIKTMSMMYLNGNTPCTSSKSLDILNRGKNLNIKESILCLLKYHKKTNNFNFHTDLIFKYKEHNLDENNIEEIKKIAFEYLKKTPYTNKYNKRLIELFEISAEKNDLESLNLLGYFYSKGELVLKDLNKALEYYEKASFLGDPWAKREINILKKIVGNSNDE